jgi:hypothetical protein
MTVKVRELIQLLSAIDPEANVRLFQQPQEKEIADLKERIASGELADDELALARLRLNQLVWG